MKNFLRALRKASRYWSSVALAAFCSFAVAALWGANIGAFYPILEVTIRGKSAQQWVQAEIDKNSEQIIAVEEQLAAATAEMQRGAASPQRQRELSNVQLESERQLKVHRAQRESYLKMQPFVMKYVPQDPFSTIALIVLALVGSTLLRHVFLISNEVLVGRVALNISNELRNELFSRALYLDRASFARQGNASFVTMIIQTTEMLSTGLMNTLGAAIREPLKLIACLAGAAVICWRLLLLSVIVAPLCGILLYFVTRKIKSVSRRVLERATGFHGVLLESLENIHTVQSFQTEKLEQGRFEDATNLMKKFGLKFLFFTSLTKPIIEFLGIGMLGTTIIGGAYLVLNNQTHLFGIQICPEPLSVSALLVFFGMLVGVSDPLRKLSAIYGSIYAGSVAANAVYPLLDQVSQIADPLHPRSTTTPHRQLSIDQACFAYHEGQNIIRDISMDIPFGSTVAIVGSNGSGKSTLINLLCRFYDPTSGQIGMDGIDYREMRVADVRSRIALVNQQTELFNNTVSYNIRYGSPSATDQEVEVAARRAHAHEFITSSLNDGYQTRVGRNGSSLSGGQRQRIALARALLRKPEILILDEATSQIDMQSEQAIRESLAEVRGEQTMIIITHREKLLELADRTFEVVEGRLVERKNNARQVA